MSPFSSMMDGFGDDLNVHKLKDDECNEVKLY